MQNMMIVATFVLGLLLALVAVVAYFKKLRAGSANLKILGIELSGQGPLVFLVVGAAFIYSGVGWATTEAEKDKTESDREACVVEKTEVEQERAAVVVVAGQLDAEVSRLVRVNADLVAAIPPPNRETLRVQRPELLEVQPRVIVPDSVRRAIEVPR